MFRGIRDYQHFQRRSVFCMKQMGIIIGKSALSQSRWSWKYTYANTSEQTLRFDKRYVTALFFNKRYVTKALCWMTISNTCLVANVVTCDLLRASPSPQEKSCSLIAPCTGTTGNKGDRKWQVAYFKGKQQQQQQKSACFSPTHAFPPPSPPLLLLLHKLWHLYCGIVSSMSVY